MRFCTLLVLAFAAACTGCTQHQLQHSTLHQARTVTDLQYDQVLTNLAATAASPDILPCFAVVGTGGAGVTDVGEASAELEWDPDALVRRMVGLTASRQVEAQWTLAPVVNPDKLRALRAAYQIAVFGRATDQEAHQILTAYLGEGYGEWVQTGWLHSGGKKDVPTDACYVGRCGHHCVWVAPDGLESLTRLTLATLNIATLDPAAPPAAPTKTVQKYTYNKDGRVETIETFTRPDLDAPKSTAPPARRDFYNPLQAQIQLRGR
jgi:hypothetical protein